MFSQYLQGDFSDLVGACAPEIVSVDTLREKPQNIIDLIELVINGKENYHFAETMGEIDLGE